MSGDTFILIWVALAADFALAAFVTRAINRRGYTGSRRSSLLMLTWLVPGIGALCAALTIREYDRDGTPADSH
jgi:hypothetical protein